MIVKNVSQLKNAITRQAKISNQIEDYKNKYSGAQFDFYVSPLMIEQQGLEKQIGIYKRLVSLPFNIAIGEVLSEPILLDNISELLSKLRIAAKMTQKEMADHLGWKQSNLSRFENENYSSQTISKIVEYVSSLGVWLQITPTLTEISKPELSVNLRPEMSRKKIEDYETTTSDILATHDDYDLVTLVPTKQNLDISTSV